MGESSIVQYLPHKHRTSIRATPSCIKDRLGNRNNQSTRTNLQLKRVDNSWPAHKAPRPPKDAEVALCLVLADARACHLGEMQWVQGACWRCCMMRGMGWGCCTPKYGMYKRPS